LYLPVFRREGIAPTTFFRHNAKNAMERKKKTKEDREREISTPLAVLKGFGAIILGREKREKKGEVTMVIGTTPQIGEKAIVKGGGTRWPALLAKEVKKGGGVVLDWEGERAELVPVLWRKRERQRRTRAGGA